MRKFLIPVFVFAAFALTCSCRAGGNYDQKQDSVIEEIKQDTTKLTQKTAKYICPMSCKGGLSNVPAKCPKCGMNEVENQYFGK